MSRRSSDKTLLKKVLTKHVSINMASSSILADRFFTAYKQAMKCISKLPADVDSEIRNKLKDNVKGMFDIYMVERNKEVDYLKKKLDSMTVVFPVDSSDESSDENRRTTSPMDQDEVRGDRQE